MSALNTSPSDNAEIQTGSEILPTARREGTSVIAAVRGEIDLYRSPELRTQLLDILVKYDPRKLVLNLTQVPYMDSSAIAVMVECLQKMRKSGGKIYLTNLQPRVKGLLEIARLDTIFIVTTDETEALAK